ncbi:MAG: adenylate cyclase, partial [Candidatus Thiodiazotropha sp. (ex Notomyrtea botanica)]|nr:adenylate cyclase [Candidatus Thiodiazotropha sp. (ex Notomyrtea botanica)]
VVPLQDADEMLQDLVTDSIIDKHRYKVRCGAHLWDLDVFYGENEGLVVAEIELDSEDEAFEMPGWAGDEVSHDVRFYNANLIKQPYKSWQP